MMIIAFCKLIYLDVRYHEIGLIEFNSDIMLKFFFSGSEIVCFFPGKRNLGYCKLYEII